MLTVRKSGIPLYLQSGELFRTLVENNDDPNEELTFPENVLKPDMSVGNAGDLEHLLNSLRYWGADYQEHHEVIDFVVHNFTPATKEVLAQFAESFTYVQKLYVIACADRRSRKDVSVLSGCLSIVQAMTKSGRDLYTEKAFYNAASENGLDILNHLHQVQPIHPIQHETIVRGVGVIACKKGFVGVLQFASQLGFKLEVNDIWDASLSGDLECIRYIYATQPQSLIDKCAEWIYISAAAHLDMLQFLYEHGVGYGYNTVPTGAAASKGQVHCLKFLHETGCGFHDETSKSAAENGHIDCLQYAVEHDCPLHPDTCSTAAKKGHLDCLMYAHEHGCPMQPDTGQEAAHNGHLACLRYAHEHGCPIDRRITMKRNNPCREYWNANFAP